MALNFLPLLLIGGGAALVATQAAKKKREDECSTEEVTISAGELKTIADRAEAKHGNEATPFNQVRFFMSEALPSGCSAGDKIRVKLDLSGHEFLDVSAADFYMLTTASAIDTRLKSGKLKDHQATKFWGDALDWYKKVTGKNFDQAALAADMMKGAGKLAQNLAEGFLEAMGDVGRTSEPGKKEQIAECPSEWSFTFDQPVIEHINHIVDSEIARENKNPRKIGDAVFESLAPEGCKKTDYQTAVEFVIDFTDWKDTQMMNMATLYVALVLQGARRMEDNGAISESALNQLKINMNAWYKGLTGSDLPGK